MRSPQSLRKELVLRKEKASIEIESRYLSLAYENRQKNTIYS